MADLTAKEVALRLETTPKRLRKFLREEVKSSGGTVGVDSPGKGGRYSIPANQVTKMRKRFDAWVVEDNKKRIERLQKANAEEVTPEDGDDTDSEETEETLDEETED